MKQLYITFSIYFVFLVLLLLWPFQIRFNNVKWLEDTNGIAFHEQGQVISLSPVASLLEALQKGDGFSLETWISTDNLYQDGPARIVSYSLDHGLRNFTLGQSQNNLIMRLRTSDTDLNAITPLIELDNVFTSSAPFHIVLTYDFSTLNIHLNGQLALSEQISSDRFASWDSSYYFILGNEATGNRPWQGNIHYLAVYNGILSKEAINSHYKLGWTPCDIHRFESCRTLDGLLVNYLFEEGEGDSIRESHQSGESLHLHIPFRITDIGRPYLTTNADITNPRQVLVIVMNILVFIPLGMLLHFILANRYGSFVGIALLTFAFGSLLSFFVENVQFFMPVRNSSLIDLFCNMLGTAIGIQIDRHPRGRRMLNDHFSINNRMNPFASPLKSDEQ